MNLSIIFIAEEFYTCYAYACLIWIWNTRSIEMDIGWVAWRSNSPATRLTVQWHVKIQVNKKNTPDVRITDPSG